MKKIASIILCLTLVFAALLALTGCQQTSDIYTLVNNSEATTVSTVVSYTSSLGDTLPGWYVTSLDGNNAIIEYSFMRYQYPDEPIKNGDEVKRIVSEAGKVYYYDGKYYNDGEFTAWVAAPSKSDFKLQLDQTKLTDIITSIDGKTLTAYMTAEACLEMFGLNLDCNEDGILLVVTTNGVNLSKIVISCESNTGASIRIESSYSYKDNDLDFSPVMDAE